jgi:cell division protein FtsL
MQHRVCMRAEREEAGAKWRELVLEQSRSGKSVSAFCDRDGYVH